MKKTDFKEVRKKIIEWFEDVAEIIKENKKIAFAALAFVCLVVCVLFISHFVALNKQEQIVAEVTTETATEDVGYVIPEDLLEEDAYPEINTLMKKYYQASADGDVEAVKSLKTNVDDKEAIVIQKKSDYIESYPVVKCYTKKGPVEDAFLVFAYYEVKLVGFDEQAPGLNAWYVCRNESGEFYINDDEQDEKLAEYCKIISVQDDVVDLNNTVNVKFNDCLAANEEFAEFIQNLPDVLTSAVGEELAKAEAETEAQTEVAEETETVSEQPEVEVKKKVKATTVVNVRGSDSEEADKIGKAQENQEFELVEEKVNGWSKIIFEGKEAFVKTEFLEVVSEEVVDTAAATENSPSNGKATATDTVNIRKSASTDADKLGKLYNGDEVEVIEKLDNGWSKIKHKSITGYVKSEYLK